MKNLRRDYLNSDERNFYMVTKAYIQMLEGNRTLTNKSLGKNFWEVLREYGMLTPSMQKSLKTAQTSLKKYLAELEENLSNTQMDNLNRRMRKFDYRIVDDFTLQKIYRDIENKSKFVTMDKENFEAILEDIASVRCANCTINYEKCSLYKAFEDAGLPPVDEHPNCPFAGDSK